MRKAVLWKARAALGVVGVLLGGCRSSGSGGGGAGTSEETDESSDTASTSLTDGPSSTGGGESTSSGSTTSHSGTTTGDENACVLPLSQLGTTIDGFVVDGEADYDSAGESVSGVGDVSGDGLADVVVGAPNAYLNAVWDAGRAYVVFGKADAAPVGLSDVAEGLGGFAMDPEAGEDLAGSAVSSADVNGDGLADMLVGAAGADRVYVVFGKADTGVVSLSEIAQGNGGFVIEPYDGSDGLAGIGEVNGDGLADMIISSAGSTAKAYVVFGKTDTAAVSLADVALGTGGFVLESENGPAGSSSVAGAGDVNGDGLQDVLVGGPRTYLVFGKADTAPVALADVAQGTGGFILDREDDLYGPTESVSGAGDVNGDGVLDLVIGAPSASCDNGDVYCGRAYVVFGKTDTAPVSLADVEAGEGGFVLEGVDMFHAAGYAVSGAGDIDGDGLADVAIGEPSTYPGGTRAGRTYVVFGRADTAATSLADVAQGIGGFALDGEQSGRSGFAVSGGGDIDGDGVPDLVIGAPGSDYADYLAGRTYVVFGTVPPCVQG